MKTAWERDDVLFMAVAAVTLAALPFSINCDQRHRLVISSKAGGTCAGGIPAKQVRGPIPFNGISHHESIP